MKKVIFSIAAAAAMVFSVNAQTDQGTLFVGGSLGFNSASSKEKSNNVTTDGPKTSVFTIAPGVGYFVADRLAVGVDLSYVSGATTRQIQGTEVKERENSFGATPYVRYFLMLSDNFGFTGTLGVNYSQGRSKVESGGQSFDGNTINNLIAGITPGIVYFPTEKIGIEANFGFFGYSSRTEKEPDGDQMTDTNFGFEMNSVNPGLRIEGVSIPLGLQFGFRYYFGGK